MKPTLKSMKATLEFSLPEDDHDFRCSSRAAELYSALWQMDQDMRNKIKHVDMDATTRQWLEEYRSEISQALEGIQP